MEIQPGDSYSRTNYPLTLAVSPGEPIRWMIAYQTERFDQAGIRRIFNHLQVLLAAIAANPHQPVGSLPLLTPGETRQIGQEWSENRLPFDLTKTALDLIGEQACLRPKAVAVHSAERSLTYAELERCSNQVAHLLRAHGARPGVIVGLGMPACPELVIAMLGIHKAGAAYLPLDPTYAGERLAYMAADSGISLLVTQPHLTGLIPLPEGQVILLGAAIGPPSWANPRLRPSRCPHPLIWPTSSTPPVRPGGPKARACCTTGSVTWCRPGGPCWIFSRATPSYSSSVSALILRLKRSSPRWLRGPPCCWRSAKNSPHRPN
jgi:non-ribosomal peptide synthetase component F